MSRSVLLSRGVTVARGFNAWSAYRDEPNRVTGESTIGVGLEFERIRLCARIGLQTPAECHPNKMLATPRVRTPLAPPTSLRFEALPGELRKLPAVRG
jgi:hypothetical protein